MGRRKVGQENIRTLYRSAGTYSVSLPINLVRQFNWRERQRLVVEQYGDGILIRDWKPDAEE